MDRTPFETHLNISDFRMFLTKSLNINEFTSKTHIKKPETLAEIVPATDYSELVTLLKQLPENHLHQTNIRIKFSNSLFQWHEVSLLKNQCGIFIEGKNIDGLFKAQRALQTLEDLSKIGHWELDLANEHLSWSPMTFQIFDLAPSADNPQLTQSLSFFIDENFDIISEAARKLIAEGTPYDLTLQMVSAKNHEKTVRIVGRAELKESQVIRCFGTIQDISAETKMKVENQVGNERFKAVADHAPLMLSFFDEQGQFEWVNQEWVKVLGWDSESMRGKDMLKEFYPDPLERNKVIAFMTSGSRGWMKFRTRTKDGHFRYTHWTNVILSNGKGVGIGRDIDDQVKAEIEIENAREEFRRIFDLVQDPLIIINSDRLFLQINPATLNILGYSETELLGRPLIAFVHPDDKDSTLAIFNQFHAQQRTLKFENRFRKKDGTYRIFSWNAYARLDSKTVYAAVRDITEEREQQLTLLNSANLASLGEMASGIAHEVNNPLAIIKGKVDLIKKKILSPQAEVEKIVNELNKIDGTVDRISKIILGLRKLARGDQEDSPIPVQLKSLVEDIFAISKERFLVNKIDLTFEIDSDLYILCRPIQLEQVLINLLNNALDATSELEAPNRWVKIKAYRFNDLRVQIAVIDGGQGIPKDIADKIMQPFFTTKPTGKGTGLGLSISKNLIESQGGLFQINKNSTNTEFLITLPTAQSAQ